MGGMGGVGGVGGGAPTVGGGGAGGAVQNVVTAVIQTDADDAMWMNSVTAPSDERLSYLPTDKADYISNDQDQESAGLRFSLDVPPGATIVSAVLTIEFIGGDYTAADEFRVRVWDSSSVPAFNDAHTELPPMHDPAGLAVLEVTGWTLPATSPVSTSHDVSPL